MRLGDLCGGETERLTAADGLMIDYIDISSVSNDSKSIIGKQTIQSRGAPSRAQWIIKANDILVSTVRPNLNAVAVYDGSFENLAVASTGFCVLRCKPRVSHRFIFNICKSKAFIKAMTEQATGASYPAVNDKIIRAFEVPNLDYDSQIQLAGRLDSIQLIIDLRKQQLRELDNLIKARFVEMFGDPKANPYGYPVHQLSEYIMYLTSGSRGWAQYCNEKGSEWFITIKNVKDCRISTTNMQAIDPPDNAEAKRTRVQEGDLLISITADLGRTGVVTKEIAEHGAYINQHLTCIRLDRMVLEPLYVAYFMESAAGKEQFEAKNQNGVKAGLNFNSINSLKLLVPPLAIQREFLEFVSQVDKSKVVEFSVFTKQAKSYII